MHFVGVASPSVDFKERRLSLIILVSLIQSVEGLEEQTEEKRILPPRVTLDLTYNIRSSLGLQPTSVP